MALNDSINNIKSKIGDKFTISDDKTSIVFDKDVFVDNLPEGLTKETVKKVEQYKQDIAYAAGLIVAEQAADIFKDNKEATVVKATVQMPVGKIVTTSVRDYTSRNPQTGAETVHHNHVSIAITTKAGGSQLREVRQAAYALADRFIK